MSITSCISISVYNLISVCSRICAAYPLSAEDAGPLIKIYSEEYAAARGRIIVRSGVGCGLVVYDRGRSVIYVSLRIRGSVVVAAVEIGTIIMIVTVIVFMVAATIVCHA